MFTSEQIDEIREHLDKAQNPLFLYDNDVDGLCSYILLRRFTDKGKGVAVKSHPDIDKGYARKVQELGADYVFVLDRPYLGSEFVEEIKSLHLPIVWIDHHDVEVEDYKYESVFRYNPVLNPDKNDEPTTFLCYSVTKRKEDMWIAMMGCLADHYLPDFRKEFISNYPDLWSKKVTKPFDALYRTGIGRLAKALSFAIKDSITHVIQLQNFLIKCPSPLDFESELSSGSKPFAKKYKQISKKYDVLLDEAKKCVEKNILFFNYGGSLSISSDLSNELCYLYPDKVIVVSYSSGPYSTLSMRGENVRDYFDQIHPLLEDATGGGHQNAIGSRMTTKDLGLFKSKLIEIVNSKSN